MKIQHILCLLFLIKPFTNPQISSQIQFNIIHFSYRIVIENAFNKLKNRFIVLKDLKIRKISFAIRLIEYAIILHNFLELNNDNLKDLYDENDNDNSNNDDDNDGDDESIINQNKIIIRKEEKKKNKSWIKLFINKLIFLYQIIFFQ